MALTKTQLDEIKHLQQLCEQEGGFSLKLNWDMLQSRKQGSKEDFFHYENGMLVGFLGVYGFGNKVEICGMVHPLYRRKGIFTKLLNAGVTEAKQRGARVILLNAPAGSQSAKGFLTQVPNRHHMTEYQMKWQGQEPHRHQKIVLRPSSEEDKALEIRLEVECFGFAEQEAAEFYDELKAASSEEFYIIEADDKPVGKMRVDHPDEEAWIYGFAVLPEHQGQGIGRNALAWIIEKEHKNGFPVFLEVEAKNAHALGLYESVGFKSFHAQEYYEYIV
ncbi:GNAT family acetyltransferase [Bacillus sp. FJAT-27225]|uniref:GNAT family N-acetyltransferase n=1 Tax=Bacillus sp. FJAT-27225 TaxID=1743144 RepID=UPI00080C2213|nr:GNAT family N-acetyltransferase [Bacillus sp. FJAT-27225]OCA87531.1 GNAT family acetyltransferase [Bacillus sp. FJAT-27225]